MIESSKNRSYVKIVAKPIENYEHKFCLTKPSSLIGNIRLEKVDSFNLFKFDDTLQTRMEKLLERKKADLLTLEETIELETIGELDRIFTYINAMLIAQNDNR